MFRATGWVAATMIAAFPIGKAAGQANASPATAYDGEWRMTGQCSAGIVVERSGSRLPALSVGPFNVTINNGRFEIVRESPISDNLAVTIRNVYKGNFRGQALTIEVAGSTSNGAAWDYLYSGNASNNTLISGSGVFRSGRGSEYTTRRNCQFTLTSVNPAPVSLAGIDRQRELDAQRTRQAQNQPSQTPVQGRTGERASRETQPSATPPTQGAAGDQRLQQLAAQRAIEEQRLREVVAAREAEEQRLQSLVAQRAAEEQRRHEVVAAREGEERRLQVLVSQRAAEEQRQRDMASQPDRRQSAQIQQPEPNQVPARAAGQTTARQVERLESAAGEIILPINERAENWRPRAAAIPIQQQQFCRIIDRFNDDITLARLVRNDVRRNNLYRERQADLSILMRNGNFENWLVRVADVTTASDGSIAILLQPPCRVMLGSDACQRNGSEIKATIKPDAPFFPELGRVSNGDFVAVSGTVLFAQQEQRGQAATQNAVYQPGTHCSGAAGAQTQDIFVTQIRGLVPQR